MKLKLKRFVVMKIGKGIVYQRSFSVAFRNNLCTKIESQKMYIRGTFTNLIHFFSFVHFQASDNEFLVEFKMLYQAQEKELWVIKSSQGKLDYVIGFALFMKEDYVG